MIRPSVLHVTTTGMSLDWLLRPQLVAFRAAGFDVITASAPGPHVEMLRDAGFEHHPIPSFGRSMDLRNDVRAARELASLVDTVRPNIVHTHNPKPGVLGRLIGRLHGLDGVVNTVHGLYAQPEDHWKRRLPVYGVERVAATCSDAELVQNIEDLETLQRLGVPPDRLHLLGNGIDLGRFAPSEATRRAGRAVAASLGLRRGVPVVGIVGRLVWEKGYQDFFDAIRCLRLAGVDCEAVVVGPAEPGKHDAVDEQTIEEMTDLGVRFLGERHDVVALLSLFDVFVLPSRREGFPRAAMEACAMGVPVVTTNIRGCRQVVLDGVNGLLYEPGESGELAEHLRLLLADPRLRRGMGAAGVDRAAAEFDQQRVIDRTMAVYRQLLRVRGMAAPQPESSERYADSIDLVAAAASNRAAPSRAPFASR